MASSLDILLVVAAVLATTGLLLFHAAVLGWRTLRRRRASGPPAREEARGREPTLAFLVPVYNDELTIGPCIESILGQTRTPHEIVVVDDGSTDGSAAIVASYQERGVRLLRLPRNMGKARAIEEGLRGVTSDLVAITDADSLVDAGYVEGILPDFDDPRVAAVAGSIESLPHTWVTAARQVEYMVNLKLQKPAEDELGCLFVLPGVSTTYRRSVLVAMGFHGDTIAEDIDLTFRLHRLGREMRFNPRALVRTSDPPTLSTYFRQIIRWDTDVWTVVFKHRDQIGRGSFGVVGFPLLMVFHVGSVALVLGVPLHLALARPGALPYYLAGQLVWDGLVAGVAAVVCRRADVLWATFSRFPTRVLSRIATLVALGRIMVGRPMRRWTKLERRATSRFLARRPP